MSCARNGGKLREPSEWCSTISVFPAPRRADRFRHQEVSGQLRPNFEDLKEENRALSFHGLPPLIHILDALGQTWPKV